MSLGIEKDQELENIRDFVLRFYPEKIEASYHREMRMVHVGTVIDDISYHESHEILNCFGYLYDPHDKQKPEEVIGIFFFVGSCAPKRNATVSSFMNEVCNVYGYPYRELVGKLPCGLWKKIKSARIKTRKTIPD